MFKNVLIFIIIISAIQVKGQLVDISFSIMDSCINNRDKTTAIQITVQNGTNKDIWVDLESIRFEIYQDGKIVTPDEITRIGLFTPKEKISKAGFLLVKKMSSEEIIIHTSLFRNYTLEMNEIYCLKGFYKKIRNRKAIYNVETNLGKLDFKICD